MKDVVEKYNTIKDANIEDNARLLFVKCSTLI